MACTGPNYDFAALQAEQAHKDIKELLESKYAINFESNKNCTFVVFNTLFNEADQDLKSAIKEIFAADATIGF
jgi:hypothetical protein